MQPCHKLFLWEHCTFDSFPSRDQLCPSHLGVFGNYCFIVPSVYICQTRNQTYIKNYKYSSYTSFSSSRSSAFISTDWTWSCKNLCALTFLSDSVGVMDVPCLSLLVSILEAGSVYTDGRRRKTDRVTLRRCLAVIFCLLAVTFLTSKKNILLTKFLSFTSFQSRKYTKRACLLMQLFRNSWKWFHIFVMWHSFQE